MQRIVSILFLSLYPLSLVADSSVHLGLRARVPPSIRTNISQTEISSTKSLWVFSNQMNSQHLRESQKFEVEGLDQHGLETHLRKVTAKDRTIQYELLVKRLKTVMISERPIFLKISAN